MLKRDSKPQLTARLVLEDCRAALADLRQVGNERALFRRRWVAAITLLRAVGHVLYNVDRGRDEIHRRVIDELWATGQPPIFTEFISYARDLTIKEYRSRVYDVVRPDSSLMSDDPRMHIEVPDSSAMAEGCFSFEDTLPVLVFRDPPFYGKPIDALVEEAIEWWERYLDDVEKQIATSPTMKATAT